MDRHADRLPLGIARRATLDDEEGGQGFPRLCLCRGLSPFGCTLNKWRSF